ncbi:branched-chain amino acid export protein large subunit [Streptomyces sp. NBRC 110611]|uniref:AzlC family ABC transporter permease n=1 Tax=Streptomyces sp. NBRC 110611 TaxID=1621259 RepID=UPI0008580251|nr:AzlC family ABC transporter permease [Streptomyces sp. NBRC 110611]GAU68727.1 branched-chain amino acid export protein large subunit [Streptomyces sp. NBRC 110611]
MTEVAARPAQPAESASAPRGDFGQALRDTVPVAMGYTPLGAAFGILLVNSGLDWYWAPLSAALIFAGSMEFLAVGMITAGTPLVQIAVMTLAVNFRHVFYALSFPMQLLKGWRRRVYGAFALTDETYSLLATIPREEMTANRLMFIQLLSHLYWVGGSLIGALLSFGLPASIDGLSFVLTALFVVLAQDCFYKRKDSAPTMMGLAAGFVALTVGEKSFLAVALTVYVAMLLGWYLLQRKRVPKELSA